ncbi:uncharacterized protein I303_104928 [Kwoniella dejecticola CBS 10117]|uniref:AB hydrolase-1 domain-containing protein n=1 Tax=Kwoniella dejecticola CBS 10117 TaxID=1296121 RepID=A0A1A6A3Y6_9TREE|nr:uncharacterized protein I303_05626 [Kwoniella dejecticola CBS 10117]OBR84767.1 hypothetical protein I303_05626 [Kwoniella dejecticola CBS 10117]
MTTYHTAQLSKGYKVFYQEAGTRTDNPTLLLLHGFPSSSNQFRQLIPLLADKFHIIAPDLPAFGLTTVPADFVASFAQIAEVIGELLDQLKIKSFIPYTFDYGAPTAYRLALNRLEAVKGLIAQNGNAYEEGLASFWDPLKVYWQKEKGSEEWKDFRSRLLGVLSLDATKGQYLDGLTKELASHVDPNAYTLDYLLNLSGEEKIERQLDLFYDYQENVKLYPQFQQFFRSSQIPTLVVWGGKDEIFPTPGAHAYKKDLPEAKVKIFEDGTHFLLETHVKQVAEEIRNFF